ncbi:MAG TPA: hypothetical protein VJA94_07615 [Candidatus Angelobacter sp.]
MTGPSQEGAQNSASPDAALEKLIHDRSPEVLVAAAGDSRLSEDLALALLTRRDLPAKALEELNKNGAVTKHRKVRLAIVMHARTPRHVSIPAIRHLYAFELMQVALFPAVAADVKRAAEETLIGRLETISAGERYALAKQSPGRVAAALLFDEDERIMQAALANPHMTEPLVVKSLRVEEVTDILVSAVSHDEKWSRRQEIKTILLTHQKTPFAKVLQFASELPVRVIQDALHSARMDEKLRNYLEAVVEKRAGGL